MPGNRFLAGLFESHLAESLLWRRLDHTDMLEQNPSAAVTTKVLTDFQVPSWSWASLDCAVICDAHKTWGDFRLLATVSQDGLTPLPRYDPAPETFVICNRVRITAQLLLLSEALQKTLVTTAFSTFPGYS